MIGDASDVVNSRYGLVSNMLVSYVPGPRFTIIALARSYHKKPEKFGLPL